MGCAPAQCAASAQCKWHEQQDEDADAVHATWYSDDQALNTSKPTASAFSNQKLQLQEDAEVDADDEADIAELSVEFRKLVSPLLGSKASEGASQKGLQEILCKLGSRIDVGRDIEEEELMRDELIEEHRHAMQENPQELKIAAPKTHSRSPLRRTCSGLNIMSTMGKTVSGRLQLIIENPRSIEQFYNINPKILGEGSFGQVRSAVVVGTGAKRAVKSISKERCKEFQGALKAEIIITKMLDHPNVVKLYEIFEDSTHLYLVMELCKSGHLMSYVRHRGEKLPELDAQIVVRQIMRGVAYLHGCSVCHRDLKPQNVLVADRDMSGNDESSLRISDFGLSTKFKTGQAMTAAVGTAAYMAPEVFQKNYDQKCDVWSCGVIMHFLLVGYLPFLGSDASKKSIRKSVVRGKLRLVAKDWLEISAEGISTMRSMLARDASKRCSAASALDEPWLIALRTTTAAAKKVGVGKGIETGEDDDVASGTNPALSGEVLSGLQAFRRENKFMKAALHLVVSLLSEEQIRLPRQAFMQLDLDGDGWVSQSELSRCFGSASGPLLEQSFSYTEFLAATFNRRRYVQRPVCKAAFSVFDADGDGLLTPDELVCGQSLLGPLSQEEAQQVVRDLDTDGDGMINFAEFYAMMRKTC
eukprot:TRINITY_DN43541_c0_g1_i1.p1 TRINITY_DN43541_c0_g1~~TRINITY_DN43541_c0_g1_i1.p1  ORF type:complete len:643 (+),score=153.31 TRINITY_DN43541_c0_g1_i1:24-1952(+)